MKPLPSLLAPRDAALALLPAGRGARLREPRVRARHRRPERRRAAMSTSLDKDDIERTLQTLLNQLRDAPVMTEWRVQAPGRATGRPSPSRRSSTRPPSTSIRSSTRCSARPRRWLVNSGIARVISQERQDEMIRQVEGAQHPVFDPRHIPQYGKQLGVKFFITGKVGASDERTDDARRVQYFIFMQVIDAETSEIRWQQKAYVTKAAAVRARRRDGRRRRGRARRCSRAARRHSEHMLPVRSALDDGQPREAHRAARRGDGREDRRGPPGGPRQRQRALRARPREHPAERRAVRRVQARPRGGRQGHRHARSRARRGGHHRRVRVLRVERQVPGAPLREAPRSTRSTC